MVTQQTSEQSPAVFDVARAPSRARRVEFDTETGFGSAYSPWIDAARDEVVRRVVDNTIPRDLAARITELSTHQLLSRLSSVAGRVLLAHYQPSPSGYHVFIENLLADEWKSMLADFPMMGELLVKVTNQWIESTTELAVRLGQDQALLRREFDFDVGSLAQLSSSLGDPHNGGRSVIGIKDGTGTRVAYKPRPMGTEAAFAAVMHHLGAIRGEAGVEGLSAPQPHTADRGAYGWMQWVDSDLPCAADEVEAFYRRVGALICVARVLSLSDLHLENLIASGPFPVVIDLECLITPHFHTEALPGDEGLRRFMRDSVMPSGLLPGSTPSFGSIAADRAGLSGLPGAVTGAFGRGWVHLGTDEIDVVARPMVVGQATNRPLPCRKRRPVPEIPTHAILDGYERSAVLLARQPFDLALLDDVRPRVLFRSTQRYVGIIGSLFEPEVLADPTAFANAVRGDVDWVSSFDELVPADAAAANGRSWQQALVDAEAAAMANLDVPAFTFDPSTGAVDFDGELFDDLFRTAPIDDVSRRITSLDVDSDAQMAMLSISLQGHRVGSAAIKTRSRRDDQSTQTNAAQGDAAHRAPLRVAEEIIDTIAVQELQVAGKTRWLTSASVSGGSLVGPTLTGGGLYQGSAGTAVVVALLAQATERDDLAALATRALIDGRTLLPDGGDEHVLDTWQLAAGRSGWAYGAAVAGQTLSDRSLIDLAAETVAPPDFEIARFDNLDLIGGWAGVVLAVDAVATMADDSSLRDRAAQLADTVAKEVTRRTTANQVAHHARLSMAHGSFGIALALRRAGAEGSVAQAVAAELEHDQDKRIGDRGGVPARVYRDGDQVRADTSWCWGTAGFLVSAADRQGNVTETIERAIASCGHGGGEIDRLCCGSAGRLVALTSIGQRADIESARADELTHDLTGHLVRAWRAGEVVGDTALDFVDTSLFRGTAGIAYALLSAANHTVNLLRIEPC